MPLNSFAEWLYKPSTVRFNRFVDVIVVYFNAVVALLLLVAPWYYIDTKGGVLFPHGPDGCTLSEGTVVAPFTSTLCGVSLSALPDGEGSEWASMHRMCWAFFAITWLIALVVYVEIIEAGGIEESRNANFVNVFLQTGNLFAISLVFAQMGNVAKPAHTDHSTALVLVSISLAITVVRLLMVLFFIYVTLYHYTGPKRGFFGTGARAYIALPV